MPASLTPASVSPEQLEYWCNNYLQTDKFQDYCPNGLQVDGGQEIYKIITGVSACQALIDAAVIAKAQAIMVHHGYFWKGESQLLTKIKGNRIRTLMQNGISLIAYHLPLDWHPNIGNNALLAQRLGIKLSEPLYPEQSHPVGNIGECAPITATNLRETIYQALQRQPLHIAPDYPKEKPDRIIQRVAICSGAAQDMLPQAALRGCDAFISGEISERTTHQARELGIDYYACGHHATERYGIETLGQQVAQHFELEVEFIDIDNPA